MIEAAAMERLRLSPLTMAVWGKGSEVTGSPSMRVWSGGGESCWRARFMARWVAFRILS
jgi:hypothetical protein